MIRKGLIMCMLTFLFSALLFDIVYYGDGLVTEFKETEKVETLPVSEISTFNPNDTDGIYLSFRYKDSKTGKEYSSQHIFTTDKSYKIGDEVEVVTRDGCPSELLCQTKRGRKRTALERAADVGFQRRMLIHIIVLAAMLIALWLPNREMIPSEFKARKKFSIVITAIFALFSVAAYVLWIVAVHDSTWDSLAYGAMSVLIYAGGSIVLLTAWIIDSLIRKKRA